MPASSTKINVAGVMVGWSWSNFASVSAGVPSSPPRTAAAAADGASATTTPPACRHASATTFIAVVFPAPAGAIPSCTTRPEQQNARTNPCCPGFNARPAVALWSRTAWTRVGWRRRPARSRAAVTIRVSASRIAVVVNRAEPCATNTDSPSARRSSTGSGTGRGTVIWTDRSGPDARATTASTRPSRSAVTTLRDWRCVSARRWWTFHVALPSLSAASTRSARASTSTSST